jgi:ankyrin repeat protein
MMCFAVCWKPELGQIWFLSVGATPLHVAAENRPVIVRTLLESGAEKKATDCGESPLFVACQRGHLDVVRCLLDYGADKDQARDTGATPLFIASERTHIDTIRLLLEVDANMNQPRTAEGGHLEVARLLIEAGAEKDLGKVRNNPKGHRTRDQWTQGTKKRESGS